ncbi:MAG TPA: tyrosine--tRNA ligase, partial [Candidatus Binatia bacterium]|nr:tyrosine--tRNA ligase [Candidatus Binatia bacterium]
HLPKIGYKPRIEIMTPLIPGLQGQGGKMSASVKHSKIDLLEDAVAVKEKLDKAFCPEGVVDGNGVLAFLKYVVMAVKEPRGEAFVITRPAKFGGDVSYATYAALEADFLAKKIHPLDLKNAVGVEINALLSPIRKKMSAHAKLIQDAYPDA